ncbi:Uncharacterised protein [Bordetella pertussis]|nr:Uncharacterised protein [Bordetella pertussis]
MRQQCAQAAGVVEVFHQVLAGRRLASTGVLRAR